MRNAVTTARHRRRASANGGQSVATSAPSDLTDISQIERLRVELSKAVGVPAVGGTTVDPYPHGHRPASHSAARDGHPVASLMRLREQAAAEIDRLLAFLDATDGDPDIEDDPSEPTDTRIKALGGHDAPHTEDDEDGADNEPSLGRPEFSFYCNENPAGDRYWQRSTSDGNQDRDQGGNDDREEACEDEGAPAGDDEPSLGWCEGMAQGQGRWGDSSDLEQG